MTSLATAHTHRGLGWGLALDKLSAALADRSA